MWHLLIYRIIIVLTIITRPLLLPFIEISTSTSSEIVNEIVVKSSIPSLSGVIADGETLRSVKMNGVVLIAPFYIKSYLTVKKSNILIFIEMFSSWFQMYHDISNITLSAIHEVLAAYVYY